MEAANLELISLICTLPVYALAFYGGGMLLFSRKRKELPWKKALGFGSLVGLSVVLATGLKLSAWPLAFFMTMAVFGALLYVFQNRTLHRLQTFQSAGWLEQQVLVGFALFAVTLGIGWGMARLGVFLGGTYGDPRIALALARSPWPFLVPLFAPFAAAVMEELVYRQFAFVWMQHWFRSSWPVPLSSSLVWAGAHLGQTFTPWYLQVIELGLLVGPLSFWTYRRFGILAVIISHFLYNAFLYARGGENPWFYTVLLAPLLLFFLRGFTRKKGLLH